MYQTFLSLCRLYTFVICIYCCWSVFFYYYYFIQKGLFIFKRRQSFAIIGDLSFQSLTYILFSLMMHYPQFLHCFLYWKISLIPHCQIASPAFSSYLFMISCLYNYFYIANNLKTHNICIYVEFFWTLFSIQYWFKEGIQFFSLLTS